MAKKKRKPIPVMVAVLTQGTISIQLSDMLVKMVVSCLRDKKYEPTIFYSKQTGVDVNRNVISKQFLQGGYKFLLMIDDDNPPLKNPLDMIEKNKDVVVFPTLMYKGDAGKIAFNVFRKTPIGWETMVNNGKSKMVKVDRAGAGCILIKRRVLEKIKCPFKTIVNPEGIRILGEDMDFSDKVWSNGFEIWANWDYCCSHYKTVDLMSVAELILKAKSNGNSITKAPPMVLHAAKKARK